MSEKPKAIVDEKYVKEQLKGVLTAIDTIMPHLNKAHTAFGGLDDQIQAMQDLKAKVTKAQAIYGQ